MVKANKDIFKAYDVRGVYGVDFDDAFAGAFANKVAAFFGAKTMVVGHDARPSSDDLAASVIRGLEAAGVRVLVIGECSTPLFYHAVNVRAADGGIMVTASHNVEQYNGFKVVGKGATMIAGEDLQRIFEDTPPHEAPGGSHQIDDVRESYADAVIARSGFSRRDMTIGVQASSVVMPTLRLISAKTGLTFVEGRTEGLHVEFDDDADRIVFYQDQEKIESDFVFALLAGRLGFRTLVHDFRFSRGAQDALRNPGTRVFVSRVGRLFIHQVMKDQDADFGGEISGHFFFKSFGYLEAPECVLLMVVNIVASSQLSLKELVAPYRTWAKSEEIKLPVNFEAFTLLEEKYKDGRIIKIDGLTAAFDDWWFNLRASNTEPVMKLVVEAKTKELLEDKLREVLVLVQAHRVA